MLKITYVRVGELRVNCYIVEKGNDCIVVDFGSDTKEDIAAVNKIIGEKKLLGIIYTHSHYDHIDGGHIMNVDQYIHKEAKKIFEMNDRDSIPYFGKIVKKPINIHYFNEGKLTFGDISFDIIYTPGHTNDSVCLLFDKFMITGDTLFHGTCGRMDLIEGDESKMKNSLLKLSKLDSKLDIYPGHGWPSILANELNWIKDFSY